jgi:DNA-binding CsgD family transcriptional regulator
LYRALRRAPQLELPLALLAAVLVSVVSPLRNELWWPACAILMLLGVVAPPARALAYCFAALIANLVAHIAGDSLHRVPAVAVIGLWIGMPLFTAGSTLIVDQLARQLTRLNARRSSQPPMRVAVWTNPPEPTAARGLLPPGRPSGHQQPSSARPASYRPSTRLTARQAEVVALLADGLRYREIADCLSISVRQVERHVSQAIGRLGVTNTYELVRALVEEGVMATPADGSTNRDPRQVEL